MHTVNIHDAKTNFSRLIKTVANGEEIMIAKAGKPVAKLVPLTGGCKKRVLGRLAGKLNISEQFDHPLPDEVLAEFEGC